MHRIKPIAILSGLTLLLILSVQSVQAKSTLWKATSEKGTLYLQGSAHVLKADNYPLAPAIEQAYSNSTALVLEVDMGEMLSPKTQQLIMNIAMLQPTDTLKSVLAPETYQQLESVAADAGLPLAAVQQFKPWFATMTLTIMKIKKMGLDESLGLDRYFYEKAKADGRKVIGLESIDFQISLFDSLSEENPNEFVRRALMELEQLENDLNRLLTAWETGDFQTLETLINKSFKAYPEQYKKFITNRNKAWAKKLSAMAGKDETYMVVVGAGHLPGDQGVINLLRKKGFIVEQL
ncbi:TraB/GumN family protein [Pontiella agarivorans]|uniref:TraB/GumN family protein n=1 Tax=Pontiella agarivorans TaxID=3038953 RepID=A0ABU5MZ21_9BACT|nr:TraB/GumN family protein [Pontiella agarivorans]MDZ8119437.1 TraB/GumN family protein [Pontiella agarivorans]